MVSTATLQIDFFRDMLKTEIIVYYENIFQYFMQNLVNINIPMLTILIY